MRGLVVTCLTLSATGCNSWSLNSDLSGAYHAYGKGDYVQVMLSLLWAKRRVRVRPYLQPEISLPHGQCLGCRSLFVDTTQTYRFIIAHYPTSEYAYRVKTWLETLRQLGRLSGASASTNAVPAHLQATGRLDRRLD